MKRQILKSKVGELLLKNQINEVFDLFNKHLIKGSQSYDLFTSISRMYKSIIQADIQGRLDRATLLREESTITNNLLKLTKYLEDDDLCVSNVPHNKPCNLIRLVT